MEAIQTDIWVRLQKLKGHDCIYVCADDAHGTAIMLSAEALGITAEALINKVNKQHQEDYADFLIEFDIFILHILKKTGLCPNLFTKRSMPMAISCGGTSTSSTIQ